MTRRTARAGAAILMGVAIAATYRSGFAQAGAVPELAAGATVDRTIRGGERHRYPIALSAGEFLFAIIDQRGADVAVRLRAADDSELVVVDSPNGTSGPERLAWVAAEAGSLQVEVESLAPATDRSERAYRLRVASRRPARDDDRTHAEAERLFGEGYRALNTNSATSRASARDALTRAAVHFRTRDLTYERGLSLYLLGLVELRSSNARASVPPLTEAQSAFDLSDPMYASVVNALGGAHDLVGDAEAGMAAYRDALERFGAAGDRLRQAITRNNIGKLYADMSNWPAALEQYRLALPIFRAVGDRRREALALANIGASYLRIGDAGRAREYLEQSLPIRRAVNDRAGEADSLTFLGLAATLDGDPQLALTHLNAALPLRQTVGDRRTEGLTLTYVGRAHLAAGDAVQAREALARAVELRGGSGDLRGRAVALTDLSDALAMGGNPADAIEKASEAADIARSMGDMNGYGAALLRLARSQRQAGQLDRSLSSVTDAIAALEQVRSGVSNPEMQASYLGRQQDVYSLAIDVYMRLHDERPQGGFDARAMQVSERARARSLLDMLSEGNADLRRGVDAALVERERQLARLLDTKADRLFAAQAARAQGEAEALRKETQTLEAEYEEVRARIRATSPEYSALTQPQPLDVDAIRREVLDAETTLVEYALGPDASYVWVLDRQSLKTYRLAPRAEIDRAARDAYELVTSRAKNVPRETPAERAQRIAASDAALPAALRRVSDLVLAPIAAFPTTSRLVVVADGALQYLPFEMLPAPRRAQATPLVADFEITALPSASTLAVHRAQLARRPAPTKGVAVFADPVFDTSDARVRQTRVASAAPATPETQTRLLTQTDDPAAAGFGSIARLRFTDDEAKAILAAAQGRQNLAAIGFDATKAAATDAGLGAYRYLHFATHGFLDTARPSLSAIALSLVGRDGAAREGFLRAHELYNLNLSADLVVLSACETGLGKEIRGEGLIGLTRAFMYAGAARVIFSLWSVSDRATSELMGRLYREMLRNGRTPSASLRAAQLALRSDARWQHPYYWAAFTIQGDWK